MTLLVMEQQSHACGRQTVPQGPDVSVRAGATSLFRPWAASEAPKDAASDSDRTSSFVQCSPPVGICAGLSRSRPQTTSPKRGASSRRRSPNNATLSTAEPILSRLEGLVGAINKDNAQSTALDDNSQSSIISQSSVTSSCPASPVSIKKEPTKKLASKSASSQDAIIYPAVCDPRLIAPSPMMSPEEIALMAAQQQALQEEALLAMALSGMPGVPAAVPGASYYLDEYARLLQQEHKAAGLAARKQRPKKYRCPHCQVAFSNNGQLRGHVRIHTGERPFKCEEESCGKRFTRNEELTRHKRIHSGLRPFACQACGKRFGRKDHLKKHARTHDPTHRVAQLIPMMPHALPHPYLYGF